MTPDRLYWLPNLDVELEWSAKGPYQRSQHIRELIENQSDSWLKRFHPERLTAIPLQGPWQAPPNAKALAWSPSAWAQKRCGEVGVELLGSVDPEILKTVNHKAFVIPLRGVRLKKQHPKTLVQTPAELWRVAQASPATELNPFSFIARRPFGATARNMLRLPSSGPTAQENRWIAATKGPWVLEPWVPILWEASTAGWVYGPDDWEVAEPRKQITDAQGQWLASQAGTSELAPYREPLKAGTVACADALAQAGYSGPFGVDSFLFKCENGEPVLNPISDCNARFTMSWPDAFPDWPDRNGLLHTWLEPSGPAA